MYISHIIVYTPSSPYSITSIFKIIAIFSNIVNVDFLIFCKLSVDIVDKSVDNYVNILGTTCLSTKKYPCKREIHILQGYDWYYSPKRSRITSSTLSILSAL